MRHPRKLHEQVLHRRHVVKMSQLHCHRNRGRSLCSSRERTILFDILNERYEKRRPTLLLSNLTLPDVQLYLGERVFDRLREDDGEVVVFDWQSWRNQKAAA